MDRALNRSLKGTNIRNLENFSRRARSQGVVEQTLSNRVKAQRAGKLKEVSGKTALTAEQMEISSPRAELARVTMERDVFHLTDEDLPVGAGHTARGAQGDNAHWTPVLGTQRYLRCAAWTAGKAKAI